MRVVLHDIAGGWKAMELFAVSCVILYSFSFSSTASRIRRALPSQILKCFLHSVPHFERWICHISLFLYLSSLLLLIPKFRQDGCVSESALSPYKAKTSRCIAILLQLN